MNNNSNTAEAVTNIMKLEMKTLLPTREWGHSPVYILPVCMIYSPLQTRLTTSHYM